MPNETKTIEELLIELDAADTQLSNKAARVIRRLNVQNENLMNFARNVVIYAGNSCDDYLADKAREVMRTNLFAGEST